MTTESKAREILAEEARKAGESVLADAIMDGGDNHAIRISVRAIERALAQPVVDEAMVERGAQAISRRNASNLGNPYPIELCRKDARVCLEAALTAAGMGVGDG